MIVSSSFMTTIIILTLMCVQLLKDTDTYLDFLCNWELLVWCMALGVYLMRFMTLGLKINKKYRNLSVLITEQINLYLQMEQKPHKKEELMVANNVLKLAEDLLKELESPFKISGVSANPVLYNIVKVVVLSAFSAVLTEICGFKLKLYKIKLKG